MKTPLGNEFVCPICGNAEYCYADSDQTIVDARHDDARETAHFSRGSLSLGYECSKCSAMFGNPDGFTKNRDETK